MGIENVKKYMEEEKRGPGNPFPEWVIKAFEEFARPDTVGQAKCAKCGTCLGYPNKPDAVKHCHWCSPPHYFRVGDKVQHKPGNWARDTSRGVVMGHSKGPGWPLINWTGERYSEALPHDPSQLELIPEPALQPGDFVRVIDPSSARADEYGEVVGPVGPHGTCYLVKFSRCGPPGPTYTERGVPQGHGWVMLLTQLRKEP